MPVCNNCGADNISNDTGYCKFCLTPLDPAGDRDNQNRRASDKATAEEGTASNDASTIRSHQSIGIMTELKRNVPTGRDDISEDPPVESRDSQIEESTPDKSDDALFEIKEVDFDDGSIPGMISDEPKPEGSFERDDYFNETDKDGSMPDTDLTDDELMAYQDDDEINIAMEQTESGPEITIASNSDLLEMPELLPREQPDESWKVNQDLQSLEEEMDSLEDDESPVTQRIIVNPQIEEKIGSVPDPEAEISEADFRPQDPVQEDSSDELPGEEPPVDHHIFETPKPPEEKIIQKPVSKDIPPASTKKEPVYDSFNPEREEFAREKAKSEPVFSLPEAHVKEIPTRSARAYGFAYIDGNNVSFTGGYKPSPGEQLIINEKLFDLKEKPPTILSKIPRPALIGGAALLMIILIAIVASIGPAEKGQVVGLLTNQTTGLPIAKASITIQEIDRTVETSYAGFFVFDEVPPGIYTVTLDDNGTSISTERLTVLENKTSTLTMNVPWKGPSASPGSRKK